MRKTRLTAALLLAVCLFLIPLGALAGETDGDCLYTMLDSGGQVVARRAGRMYVSDEYISGDNRLYRVTAVDTAHETAFAEDLGEATIDEAALSAFQSLTARAEATEKPDGKKLICMYSTHSDESYVPDDGDFSLWHGAGIYDVGNALKDELEELGVKPDMAVGDFDSLGYIPKCRRVSRFPVKKDKSDMELALEKAVAWDYDDLVVYAALGGRLDHTIANLQLFAKFSEREFYVTAVGADSALRALTGPDVMDLPLMESGTVSVFSANDCARGVIETGMLYSLDDEDLSNRTSRGVSNELVGKPARIAVEEGTLYVFYPLP